MSEELKPCPECGNSNVYTEYDTDDKTNKTYYFAKCYQCGHTVRLASKAGLIDYWNSRPQYNEKPEVMQSKIGRLTQRVRELEEEVKESNGLLRSAYQIAKRDGKDTNWEAFRNQVYIALVRQHEQMYGEESEEE